MRLLRRVISKQLGELLIERGIITREKLDRALIVQKESGGLLGQILVKLEFVKEEEIAQSLTAQFGFPYLPLENYEIDPAVTKRIPKTVALQCMLVPIDRVGNVLTIAMADPLNGQAVEDVELVTKCKVQVFVSTITDIKEAIEKYYK